MKTELLEFAIIQNYCIKEFLPLGLEEQVKELFFFNVDQKRYSCKIIEILKTYGKPIIYRYNHFFTIRLEKELFQQTAFILKKK